MIARIVIRAWYRIAPVPATRWYVRECKRDRIGKPADPVVFGTSGSSDRPSRYGDIQ